MLLNGDVNGRYELLYYSIFIMIQYCTCTVRTVHYVQYFAVKSTTVLVLLFCSDHPMSKKSSSWRIPTAQNCQKYGLKALPDDFEPTKEEKMLLDAYEYVNRLQRTADRLKTDAAMKKLKDRNVEFMKYKL
mgnify:CR=1 FL=1